MKITAKAKMAYIKLEDKNTGKQNIQKTSAQLVLVLFQNTPSLLTVLIKQTEFKKTNSVWSIAVWPCFYNLLFLHRNKPLK